MDYLVLPKDYRYSPEYHKYNYSSEEFYSDEAFRFRQAHILEQAGIAVTHDRVFNVEKAKRTIDAFKSYVSSEHPGFDPSLYRLAYIFADRLSRRLCVAEANALFTGASRRRSLFGDCHMLDVSLSKRFPKWWSLHFPQGDPEGNLIADVRLFTDSQEKFGLQMLILFDEAMVDLNVMKCFKSGFLDEKIS